MHIVGTSCDSDRVEARIWNMDSTRPRGHILDRLTLPCPSSLLFVGSSNSLLVASLVILTEATMAIERDATANSTPQKTASTLVLSKVEGPITTPPLYTVVLRCYFPKLLSCSLIYALLKASRSLGRPWPKPRARGLADLKMQPPLLVLDHRFGSNASP